MKEYLVAYTAYTAGDNRLIAGNINISSISSISKEDLKDIINEIIETSSLDLQEKSITIWNIIKLKNSRKKGKE